MKKLHSFLFYALVTPAIALSAGSLMAQTSSAQDTTRQQQSSELDKDGQKSSLSDQNSQGQDSGQTGSMTGTAGADAGQAGSMTGTDRTNAGQAGMQNRGYLDSAPVNGTQASDLIGATVRTGTDDDVGSVSELIIDESGQIVAILVGVGGFLGMGEKDVAIGWDHVTLSGTGDDQDLRVDVTGDELRSAPKYANR